ncbi:MAG: PAS domain S-box protein, partial [Myxococcales bacterium]|nr:PAS domain S-box protein [Myxococcales bacterium]
MDTEPSPDLARENQDLRRQLAALQEAEDRFRLFFDNAPIGKTITAPDGTLLRVNPAFCAMVGYTADELMAARFATLTHPGDVAISQDRAAQLLAGTIDTATFEKRYLTRTGGVVWTQVSVRLQRDAAGAPRYFITHVIDVTEARTQRLALREAEEAYRTFLDNTEDVVTIVDAAGAYRYVNQAAERALGRPMADLVGRSMFASLHPDDVARTRAAFARWDDERVRTAVLDNRVVGADGVVRDLSWTLLPRRGADGAVDSIWSIGRDVTARNLADAALRASEARFRRIAEHAPDMIYRVSLPDHRVEYVSPVVERILGYTPAEIYATPTLLSTCVHPDARAVRRALWDPSSVTARRTGHDLQIIAKDGTVKWIDERTVVVHDDAGAPVAIEGIVADITVRKRAMQELERSNRELEQFAYVASHDLQEPLRMVSSYTQLLARRYGDALDQDAHDFIGFAVDGATRMQRLIQDLLAYSRVTTRGRPLGDVDAGAALTGALANLQAAIDASAAVVTQEPLPHLPADAGQLTQLFQNLVANAIKFRRPGEAPRIHVGCRRVAGAWEVAVRDEGIGIDPRFFDRIFTIFRRLHTQ